MLSGPHSTELARPLLFSPSFILLNTAVLVKGDLWVSDVGQAGVKEPVVMAGGDFNGCLTCGGPSTLLLPSQGSYCAGLRQRRP